MSQSEIIQAALREYQEDQMQGDVLKTLEPGNEFLIDLVDSFGKARRDTNKAQVACFYELKSSNVGAIVGGHDRVVCMSWLIAVVFKAKCMCRSSLSMKALVAWICPT
jgi:hypothetical protein